MKIKRYVAPDVRQALRLVREEQGPDAVILSNRRVAEGVEILAAVDYEEEALRPAARPASPALPVSPSAPPSPLNPALASADNQREGRVRAGEGRPGPAEAALEEMRRELRMLRGMVEGQLAELAWRDYRHRAPLHAELVRRLEALGLGQALARELVRPLPPAGDDAERAWEEALRALARRIPLSRDDPLESGGVVALVGPTGVGKTTTVAKLAARYALHRGVRRIALVTTDNFRVAAHEQLRTYGRLLDVPVRVAQDAAELAALLDELADRELVLVDTAGMGQRDLRLGEQLGLLHGAGGRVRSYLVLAASTDPAALDEVVRAFGRVPLEGCILTKLDEATALGGALEAVIRHRLPVLCVSDGQRVPEDLHPADAEDLAARAALVAAERSRRTPEGLAAAAGDGLHV